MQIILIVYVAISLMLLPLHIADFLHCSRRENSGVLTRGGRIAAVVLSLIAVWFWPISLPYCVIVHILRRNWWTLVYAGAMTLLLLCVGATTLRTLVLVGVIHP
jgi:uncharacterized membrane protein